MRNFLQIATGVDVTPLQLAISRRPELWKEDTYLRDYPQGPFKDIESILLRFPTKGGVEGTEAVQNPESKFDQHENVDYPPYKLLHEARPIVMSLMTRVNGERLGRVIINKIRPGGVIFPHADSKDHADYYSRFHVVLKSQPGVYFRCVDESIHMATGEVWWFNNGLEHEVKNNSADERIHLIVDIRTSR